MHLVPGSVAGERVTRAGRFARSSLVLRDMRLQRRCARPRGFRCSLGHQCDDLSPGLASVGPSEARIWLCAAAGGRRAGMSFILQEAAMGVV
jgi:hypothetical protein